MENKVQRIPVASQIGIFVSKLIGHQYNSQKWNSSVHSFIFATNKRSLPSLWQALC